MTGIVATWRVLTQFGVFNVRKERENLASYAANALVVPLSVAYSGVMLSPDDIAAQRAWIVGSIVLGIGMSSLAVVCLSLVNDRVGGGDRLLATLPIDPLFRLGAWLASGVAVAVAAAMAGAAVLAGLGLTADVGSEALVGVVAVALGGGLWLSALGVLLGLAVRSLATADLAVTLCGLVLAIVSPVFYPVEALPAALQPLAWLSPYTPMTQLATRLAAGGGLSIAEVAALYGLAGVAIVTAAWRTLRSRGG